MSVLLESRALNRLVVVIVLSALLAISGQAAVAELAPILRDPQTAQLRVTSLSDGSLRPAYSTASHNTVLRICLETITSAYARLLPARQRDTLLGACAEDARDVLALTPTSGFGQFMTAFVALERDDIALARQAIAMSTITSYNEYWLARLRANFVEENYDLLGGAELGDHPHDLFLALHGEPGRTELARRYWREKDAAERIKVAAELLPADLQDRFFWAVYNQRPLNAK